MTVEFKAKGTRGEIWLYDQIGASMWGDGISAKSFQRELSALGKVSTINLRINSPGGDVFDGTTIYNLLKSHPATIEVDIDGIAASIASVIAMCGDKIRIAANAMMMIHEPQGGAFGDASEMRRMAAVLEQVRGNLVNTYAMRTGQPVDKLNSWLADETWMTAESAVELGFADLITQEQQVTASVDLRRAYKHVPASLQASAAARSSADILRVRLQQQALRHHAAVA
jgi:ATP-dependent Clp protease protease subunit